MYRTNSQATHADVELEVTAVHPDGADDTSILACRIQDANNMYAVQFNEDSSQLYKRVSGTWTQLDTTNSQIADDSVVTLTCNGSSITFEDDGVEILGATDSSITSAGYGGVGMGAVIVAGNDVSTQSLDNFTMTTLGGGGGTETDTTTFFINNLYETTDTGTTTKHIYAGDMLVASIEGSGPGALTYYNHLDHLNSTRVTTDGIGATQTLTDYYPFGDSRIDAEYGDFRQYLQHTGHYKDDETSLIYQGTRYYDGAIGRFISLDTWEGDLRNPQSLNKYSYGYNNPVIFIDPDGRKAEQSFMLTIYSMHPTVRSLVLNEFETYKREAPKAAAAAGAVTIGGFAIMSNPGTAFGVVTSDAGLGALGNMSFYAYQDLQDGSIDQSTQEYLQTGVIGGLTGYTLRNASLPVLMGGEFLSSAAENKLSGEEISKSDALLSAGSVMVARGVVGGASPTTQGSNQTFSQQLTQLKTAVTALMIKIGGSEIINENKRKNDKERN